MGRSLGDTLQPGPPRERAPRTCSRAQPARGRQPAEPPGREAQPGAVLSVSSMKLRGTVGFPRGRWPGRPHWSRAGQGRGPRRPRLRVATRHTAPRLEEASPEGQRPARSQSSAAREAVKGRHTPWAKGRWGAREVGVVSPQVHLRSPLKCGWTAFAGLCDLRAPFKEKNTKLLNQK